MADPAWQEDTPLVSQVEGPCKPSDGSRTPTPPRGTLRAGTAGGLPAEATPVQAIVTPGAARAQQQQQAETEDLRLTAARLRQQGLGHATALVEQAARLVLAAHANQSWTEEVTDDTDIHAGLLRSCNDLFNALESNNAGLIEARGLSTIQSIKRMGLAPYQDVRSIYSEEDMIALSAQLQRGSEKDAKRRVHFGAFSSITAYIEI